MSWKFSLLLKQSISTIANYLQKLSSLRSEVEETSAKNEELQAEVKNLKQESISKEQEIKSLTHRNGLLEAEVEKLEAGIKEAKEIAGQSRDHSTQNESLQRRLQLLEDEAEEQDVRLLDCCAWLCIVVKRRSTWMLGCKIVVFVNSCRLSAAMNEPDLRVPAGQGK